MKYQFEAETHALTLCRKNFRDCKVEGHRSVGIIRLEDSNACEVVVTAVGALPR